ncbi:MAG: 1-acyl-sn-glycerol-3-phosphate acyltransferase [Candidatus Aminicenantales bacterium]
MTPAADRTEMKDLLLPPFRLTRRGAVISRLLSDAHVFRAAREYARDQGGSLEWAFGKVRLYADEIVPAPNIYFYYRLGNRLGKSAIRMLYRVRTGFADSAGDQRIKPRSSLVFIMNHRSNMDYALLVYLSLKRMALSFAVGEWARVWPLRPLMKSMGAFFIRRGSQNSLYRAVLARYVQMATESGLVQAIYPEGRLSRDGKIGEPKLGLLDYMLRAFDPGAARDLVFIPVGVNYDRVFEDRTLLLTGDPLAARKTGLAAARTTLSFIDRNLRLMLRRGWHRFGYAVVNFGTPLSMREYVSRHGIDFSSLGKDARIEKVKGLADELMAGVARVIPVVPVALVSSVMAEDPKAPLEGREIEERSYRLIEGLEARGAHVYVPRHDRQYAVRVGLRMLTLRRLVIKTEGVYRVVPGELPLLRFYANSISHLLA